MTTPAFDIAFPRPLALALVEHIEAILAENNADAPLSTGYVDWANKCVSRLRAGEDGLASLDDFDMGMLEKDVLPEFFGAQNKVLREMLEGDADKEEMLRVVEGMQTATEMMSRLHRATNYDIFDANWKGDCR